MKKLICLFLTLALLLSLAPCAFAEVVDDEQTIDGDFDTQDPLYVTDTGSLTATSEDSHATVVISNSLTNEGSITVISNDTGYVRVLEDLTNNGTISATSENGSMDVHTEGTLKNSNSITVTGAGTAEVVGGRDMTSDMTQGLINDGTIEVTSTGSDGTARVRTHNMSKLVNNEGKSIHITGGKVAQLETGIMENYGEITLDGPQVSVGVTLAPDTGDAADLIANGENYLSDAESLKNYGTITINSNDESINGTYYGVNYVDDQGGILGSALTSWLEGLAGSEVQLKTDYEEKADHNFFWLVNGQKYNPGESFIVNSLTSIKAFWEAIINTDPASPVRENHETGKKAVEHIIKHIEGLKVLDADRREMEIEKEYLAVAQTSFNRLIVVFSWEQMSQMEKGEHLFYIVLPDGAEVEYTLTIW